MELLLGPVITAWLCPLLSGGTRPAGEDGTAAGLIFALSPLGAADT